MLYNNVRKPYSFLIIEKEDIYMSYQKPIVHGTFDNETPTKCLKCANRVYQDGKYVCSKNPEGKFVAKLAYSCFTYPQNFIKNKK